MRTIEDGALPCILFVGEAGLEADLITRLIFKHLEINLADEDEEFLQSSKQLTRMPRKLDGAVHTCIFVFSNIGSARRVDPSFQHLCFAEP